MYGNYAIYTVLLTFETLLPNMGISPATTSAYIAQRATKIFRDETIAAINMNFKAKMITFYDTLEEAEAAFRKENSKVCGLKMINECKKTYVADFKAVALLKVTTDRNREAKYTTSLLKTTTYIPSDCIHITCDLKNAIRAQHGKEAIAS